MLKQLRSFGDGWQELFDARRSFRLMVTFFFEI